MAKKKEIKLGTKEYPYCSNRQCEDQMCLRNWKYAPWNILLWRENYTVDKKGICKNKIDDI